MGKFDGVLDEVYGKQNTKLTSVLDEIYGPAVEPVTIEENKPVTMAPSIHNFLDEATQPYSGENLVKGIDQAVEPITETARKLFTAPPNQDIVVPEELDMSSMQAARDRQAMLPPSMPAEPGYVPPAGIVGGLEAALPMAYQATKKGISGAIEAAAENIPVTSFPTAPIAEYMQGVGEGAEGEMQKIIQEKQIRPGTISGVATDVGTSVLQFAPILGASIISPTLAPYGLGLLATISGGDKYQKAKEAGFTEEQALAQGIAYGVAEVVGEKIGLDALLNAYKNPAVRQSVTGFIKQVAKQAGIGAGEEGVTQIMQNAIDITAKKVNPYTAGEAPAITQDVLYAAGVGGIGQGIIGGGLGALQSIMTGQQQPQPEAPIEKPVDTQMTEFLKKQNNARDNVRTTADVEKQMQEAEALRKISDEYNQLMRDEAKGKPTGEEIKRQRAEQMKSQAGFAEETQIDDTEAVMREAQKAATQAQQADARQRKANVLEGLFGQQEPQPMEGGRSLPYPKNDVIQEIRDAGLKTKDEVVAFFSGRHNITREGASNLLKIAYNQPLPERTYKTPPSKPPVQPPTIDQLFTRKPTVTFGGEGERTGEAIPEGKGMTIQPTAPSNKLDQLFKRELSRLDNYVKDFAPRDKTRIKNQLQTIDKIADEYGNIEILYDEKGKPQYKLSTKDGKEYRRINKTEYEYLKSIGKEAIEAKKPLQFSDLENMSDEEILAIPERELEKVARAESVPFRDRVDFNIRLNKIKPSTPPPEPQQATEVAPKDITPQPAEPTAVKTPEVKEPWQMTKEEYSQQPDVFFHGSKSKTIDEFVPGKAQAYGEAVYFAKDRKSISDFEQDGTYYPAKLDLKNPYIEGQTEIDWNKAKKSKAWEKEVRRTARKSQSEESILDDIETGYPEDIFNDIEAGQFRNDLIKELGYDGIINPDEMEYGQEIAVFNPKAIRTHRNEVKQALSEGKPVPPEVLAEYPDLQPRPKSGPGMFGGATVQNMYEEIAPKVKKGADMLFKKGKQAYETVKRNADPTRDKGRVISITEIDGRPVEDEPPIRPRIGLFNLQNVYESVFGKPRQSDNRITIGDPKIGTKINDMYDRTEATRKNLDEQAEKKRPSTYATTKQSMIDVFMPYLDIVKNDSARYEQALSKLHDVFYIPSAVEGFLLDLRDEILTPVQKAGKTYRDYSAYRMAKWTLTGRAKVKSPLSLKEAQDFIDSIDAPTKKLFEDITTKFHERVWKNVLKEVESTGLKDDKTINFIMDKENYATFFPAKQMGLSYGSREYKPSGEIFKLTEVGYTDDIQDVLTSLTQKGIAMLTHANINAAKLEAFDILKTYSPNDITPAKQSMKGYTKIKDSNGNEIEIPIMEFDEPAPNSQMALLTARDKGKAVGYYVPKQFATSFDEALGSGEQLHDALRYFSNATQAIKNVWIDYNPPWQLFTNIVRDIPAAMIEMPGFKKPVKFAGKVIRNAPAAIGDYIPVIGKALQIMTGYDRAKFDAQVKKMLKEKKLLSSKDVQQLGDYNISVFDRIQNAFDTFPREGESKKFLQQVKAFGKDVERLVKTAFDETLVESQEFTDDEIVNMTRRGGSPAFAVRGGGKAFNVATTGLVFYNAVKEGWRAGKYFYEKDPVGFVIKASIPLSIFSFGVAAVSGAFGDEWKKAYLAIKKSDRENKLTFPLWWEPDGQIKYIALSMPQFLKPFMTAINEFGSADARILEGMADAFSNEMPSLNPVFDIAKTLALYGQNKPPIDRFGNPIMTQDQWTAGGPDKAINMLKAISNQNLFGSIYRFPIKPSETKKDLFSLTSLYDATFGKILKTSFAPAMDTEKEEANAAKARLLMREAIEIEKSDPVKYQKLRDEIRKLGVIPSRQFMRSVRRSLNIEREEKAGMITKREAYEKKLRSQPKEKRKKYNELFRK